MPRGPKGEKRPADAAGCAVMVAKIATGEARLGPAAWQVRNAPNSQGRVVSHFPNCPTFAGCQHLITHVSIYVS